jgi:RNA polymerase sigma factor (sigma-70 family)
MLSKNEKKDGEQNDTLLVENILKHKDSRSEKMLYDKYSVVIYNNIKRKWGFQHANDDNVSDIIIKVFTKLHKFDKNKSDFGGWVYTITKNHMTDVYRSLTNKNFICCYTDINNLNDMDYNLNNNQQLTSVEYDLSKLLSDDEYQMLNLKYVDGYTYDQIGCMYNISSTTASNKVNYIKTKLKNKVRL